MAVSPRELVALAIALAVPVLVGLVGGKVTMSSRDSWYRRLRKPAWTPPDWVFGPVWMALYLAMGTASWLVWREDPQSATVQQALMIYGVQLIVNLAWSFIFFGFRSVGGGLITIVALWFLVLLNGVLFYEINELAGLLFVPYLLWVSFAMALNRVLRQLNPHGARPEVESGRRRYPSRPRPKRGQPPYRRGPRTRERRRRPM